MNRRIDYRFIINTGTLILLDLALLWLSYWLAYNLRFELAFLPLQENGSWRSYSDIIRVQAVLLPIIFATQGLYRLRRTLSRTEELYRVFTALSISTLLALVFSLFVAADFVLSRGVVLVAWFLGIVLITLGRYLHYVISAALRAVGVHAERTLILGTNDTARMVYERMVQSPQLGYDPIGFLRCASGGDATTFLGLPVLGDLDEVDKVVQGQNVQHVIVAVPDLPHAELVALVGKCRAVDVNIRVFPDVFQLLAGQVNIDELNGLPLVTVKDIALKGYRLALKRLLDVVCSAGGLIVLSGPLLVIAILVKLSDLKAPVFYTQERVGLDGKPFQVIKFRTMRPDAEASTGPVWAVKSDPRRTRLGSFLRRTSIDELPQLINVLIGEMSLVGPRPERPYFVQQFAASIPRYQERHREKAGLTGWAAVNGLRGNTSIEDRTAYDLWYVENWTLWLDIKIILRSLLIPFKDDNAY